MKLPSDRVFIDITEDDISIFVFGGDDPVTNAFAKHNLDVTVRGVSVHLENASTGESRLLSLPQKARDFLEDMLLSRRLYPCSFWVDLK